MATMPEPIARLLDAALVGELSVVDGRGRPVTYPLIPLWDGEKVYMTSSTLFSRKLEHIRANPKVSLSITDPVAVGGATDRATIQGDARIIEDDPHGGWATAPDLGEEGALDRLLLEGSSGFAALLRASLDRDHAAAGVVLVGRECRNGSPLDGHRRGGRVMRRTPEVDAQAGLEKLATYPYQVATWIDDAGYPVSVAVEAQIDLAAGTARFDAPAGLSIPVVGDISMTGSHIRPQPGYGYDERRHITVWGPAVVTDGTVVLRGRTAWGWDEAEVPFFEYSERSTGQSRKYFDALSAERGTPVKPHLSFGFLTLRTTRLPFLTATIVPVTLGILIAARHGSFDLVAAILTIVGRRSSSSASMSPTTSSIPSRALTTPMSPPPSSAAAHGSSSTGWSACGKWRPSRPSSTCWPASSG